jgi:hypothetical protein
LFNRAIKKFEQFKGLIKDLLFFIRHGDINFYETAVGIKRRKIRFNSEKFPDFVIRQEKFDLNADYGLEDFILPPDGLKNKYTWTGTSIGSSPHIHLMKDIDNGKINVSNYIKLSEKGILDSRSPKEVNVDRLLEKYEEKKTYLDNGNVFDIYVLPAKQKNKFIISDGKHRLALAVYHNKFSQIRLNYIDNKVFENKYHQKFYSNILKRSDSKYSINKEIVLEIV